MAEQGERTIEMTLKLVGEDRILWGTDYPHIDSLTVADNLPTDFAVLARNAEQAFRL